jgi:predicted AAA+ superfamily ATPase
MSISNRDRVGRALDILTSGLKPFVEREMASKYGHRWRYEAIGSLQDHYITDDGNDLRLDISALLRIMWDQWNQVFSKTLGFSERSYVSELRSTRNKWAHQEAFSTDDAYRMLDTTQRLLQAIADGERAEEIGKQKYELQRLNYDEQRRNVTRRNTGPLVEGQPIPGLLPWRQIVTPHQDVASGNYAMAEFAADLALVHRGQGSGEYLYPRSFFQRTYLTNGLKQLLSGALQRLSGKGGNPIIELQTNFGGGKTHSLLALYHLFSGTSTSDLIGIEPLLTDLGMQRPPVAQRAVLVGYALSPAETREKEDGCVVRTLWGELAWQLMGRKGYAMVETANQQGVSPSSETLRSLFLAAGPSLILIDEWIVFVRQLYGNSTLVAGTFDANLSFAQALTEAAKASPHTLVVATLPASKNESGGEGGQEALARLKQIFGRVESPWRPADRDEGFEIVRRRLFEPIIDPDLYIARDAIAHKFSEFYRSQRQEFPDECSEANYERRIQSAYPIHPELFDRLFSDWSSIEKFQRTRGVLRLMAAIVHELWATQDQSYLIMPCNIPIDTPFVQSVLTDYLAENWVPIISKDVDGNEALPRRIDKETSFARYSAARRVARTVFFGSAPTLHSANQGIQDKHIKLGCAQPNETVATFGDALRRLSEQATYLYQNERRYWYDIQPSAARLAQDRAGQYDIDTIYEEIKRTLKDEQENRGEFARVHLCPNSGAEVADEDTAVRLVILKPQHTHTRKSTNSVAIEEARKILALRGNAPRNYGNTIIFLVADQARVDDLQKATRLALAWESIEREHETLNLNAFQRKQARERSQASKEHVIALIPETYCWLLVPEQLDPRQKSDKLTEYKLPPRAGKGLLATNASSLLDTEELLITQLAGVRLRYELDRIPLWRGNHVSIKELTENFAKYVYLPRLKNKNVLLDAIRDGVQAVQWEKETFAYAAGWDESNQRYLQLVAGQPVKVIVDGQSVLVKPAAAAAQLEAEAREREAKRQASLAQAEAAKASQTYVANKPELPTPLIGERGSTMILTSTGTGQVPLTTPYQQPHPPIEKQFHRFYASVQINERMMGSEAGRVMDEVVKHLTSLSNVKVKVTLEIEAELPNGLPQNIVRTIKENGNTLHFESCEFEES